MRRAVVLAVVVVVWLLASGHLFAYAGASTVPGGVYGVWNVDGCDAGIAADASGREYGICLHWRGKE